MPLKEGPARREPERVPECVEAEMVVDVVVKGSVTEEADCPGHAIRAVTPQRAQEFVVAVSGCDDDVVADAIARQMARVGALAVGRGRKKLREKGPVPVESEVERLATPRGTVVAVRAEVAHKLVAGRTVVICEVRAWEVLTHAVPSRRAACTSLFLRRRQHQQEPRHDCCGEFSDTGLRFARTRCADHDRDGDEEARSAREGGEREHSEQIQLREERYES